MKIIILVIGFMLLLDESWGHIHPSEKGHQHTQTFIHPPHPPGGNGHGGRGPAFRGTVKDTVGYTYESPEVPSEPEKQGTPSRIYTPPQETIKSHKRYTPPPRTYTLPDKTNLPLQDKYIPPQMQLHEAPKPSPNRPETSIKPQQIYTLPSESPIPPSEVLSPPQETYNLPVNPMEFSERSFSLTESESSGSPFSNDFQQEYSISHTTSEGHRHVNSPNQQTVIQSGFIPPDNMQTISKGSMGISHQSSSFANPVQEYNFFNGPPAHQTFLPTSVDDSSFGQQSYVSPTLESGLSPDSSEDSVFDGTSLPIQPPQTSTRRSFTNTHSSSIRNQEPSGIYAGPPSPLNTFPPAPVSESAFSSPLPFPSLADRMSFRPNVSPISFTIEDAMAHPGNFRDGFGRSYEPTPSNLRGPDSFELVGGIVEDKFGLPFFVKQSIQGQNIQEHSSFQNNIIQSNSHLSSLSENNPQQSYNQPSPSPENFSPPSGQQLLLTSPVAEPSQKYILPSNPFPIQDYEKTQPEQNFAPVTSHQIVGSSVLVGDKDQTNFGSDLESNIFAPESNYIPPGHTNIGEQNSIPVLSNVSPFTSFQSTTTGQEPSELQESIQSNNPSVNLYSPPEVTNHGEGTAHSVDTFGNVVQNQNIQNSYLPIESTVQQLLQPEQNYDLPQPTLDPPEQGFISKEQVFDLPEQTYIPPEQTYSSPQQSLVPSSHSKPTPSGEIFSQPSISSASQGSGQREHNLGVSEPGNSYEQNFAPPSISISSSTSSQSNFNHQSFSTSGQNYGQEMQTFNSLSSPQSLNESPGLLGQNLGNSFSIQSPEQTIGPELISSPGQPFLHDQNFDPSSSSITDSNSLPDKNHGSIERTYNVPQQNYIPPDQNFIPIEQSAIRPGQSFDHTGQLYSPPQNSFGPTANSRPEQTFVSSQQNFSPHEQSFGSVSYSINEQNSGPLQQNFSPPEQIIGPVSISKPEQSYSLPEQSFNPAEPNFVPLLTSKPEQIYNLPQQNFNPPEQSFGPVSISKPEQTFGSLNEGYNPPEQIPSLVANLKPEQNYGPPQQTFSQPEQNYGPPQQTFSQPEQNYGPPQQTFSQPEQSFGLVSNSKPEQIYDPPQQTFSNPEQSFGLVSNSKPEQIYDPPQQNFSPPEQSFGPMSTSKPDQTYNLPEQNFNPPEQNPGLVSISIPEQSYDLPEQSFKPPEQNPVIVSIPNPEQTYNLPTQSFNRPEQSFGPSISSNSEQTFVSPDQNFGLVSISKPEQTYSLPEQSFSPPVQTTGPVTILKPEQTYILPEQNYSPPQQSFGPPSSLKPEQNFGPPTSSEPQQPHSSLEQNYVPPQQSFIPSSNSKPEQTYDLPVQDYIPPQQNFGPPLNSNPEETYGPPQEGFGSPPLSKPQQNYIPPENSDPSSISKPNQSFGFPEHNSNLFIHSEGQSSMLPNPSQGGSPEQSFEGPLISEENYDPPRQLYTLPKQGSVTNMPDVSLISAIPDPEKPQTSSGVSEAQLPVYGGPQSFFVAAKHNYDLFHGQDRFGINQKVTDTKPGIQNGGAESYRPPDEKDRPPQIYGTPVEESDRQSGFQSPEQNFGSLGQTYDSLSDTKIPDQTYNLPNKDNDPPSSSKIPDQTYGVPNGNDRTSEESYDQPSVYSEPGNVDSEYLPPTNSFGSQESIQTSGRPNPPEYEGPGSFFVAAKHNYGIVHSPGKGEGGSQLLQDSEGNSKESEEYGVLSTSGDSLSDEINSHGTVEDSFIPTFSNSDHSLGVDPPNEGSSLNYQSSSTSSQGDSFSVSHSSTKSYSSSSSSSSTSLHSEDSLPSSSSSSEASPSSASSCSPSASDPDGDCVRGEALKDYPAFTSVPETSFQCQGRAPGFYADEETQCQVWHYCLTDGRQESFLCPTGTLFNQRHFICDWWFNTNCNSAQEFYRLNDALYERYTESRTSPTSSEGRKENETPIVTDVSPAARGLGNNEGLQESFSRSDVPKESYSLASDSRPEESYGLPRKGYGRH